MHHQVESVSKNQSHVTAPNVLMTLDVLHYQGKLSKCQSNAAAAKALVALIGSSNRQRAKKVSVASLTLFF